MEVLATQYSGQPCKDLTVICGWIYATTCIRRWCVGLGLDVDFSILGRRPVVKIATHFAGYKFFFEIGWRH